jgi:ketosteroid isomerase-like protein
MIASGCGLVVVMTLAAGAQTVSPGLERANPEMTAAAESDVRRTVEDFLEKLGGRDVAGVRALLAPKVVIAVVRQQQDGTFANSYQSREEFIAQLEKNANAPPFKEPIANVAITIDSGRLAYLRADFTVVREGKVLSSGVDQFTLVRERDGWRIAAIAYTSLRN